MASLLFPLHLGLITEMSLPSKAVGADRGRYLGLQIDRPLGCRSFRKLGHILTSRGRERLNHSHLRYFSGGKVFFQLPGILHTEMAAPISPSALLPVSLPALFIPRRICGSVLPVSCLDVTGSQEEGSVT